MSGVEISYVVIGRNEERRLQRCLQAVLDQQYSGPREVLYVDSRSTDRSVEIARALPGVEVLSVTDPRPSAAKGRNLGWQRARGELVQFVDGDATLTSDWTAHAVEAMRDPQVAAAFGWYVEEQPERSLYNRFADIDWPRQSGEVEAFGGIVMLRRRCLEEAGGFPEHVLSGEEPVLALALRERGYRFVQLPVLMARHDIDIGDFKTYWRRSVATGVSLAEQAGRGGGGARRKIAVNAIYLAALLLALVLALVLEPWAALATGAVLALDLLRIAVRNRARAGSLGAALAYAAHVRFLALPQTIGYLRWRRQRARLEPCSTT